MYGVILWSDPKVGKAVIWCEDHGNLAYYEDPAKAERDAASGFFDTGDYVEFDVTEDEDLRRASNAQTIMARVSGFSTVQIPSEQPRQIDKAPAMPVPSSSSAVVQLSDYR